MNGNGAHAHFFTITRTDEFLISRGDCKCGAVRFYPNDTDKDIIKRAAELNRELGRRGGADMTDKREPKDARPPVPPKPPNRWYMAKYYDNNREQILRDLAELGESEMRRRWGISKATWQTTKHGEPAGLVVRWGLLNVAPAGDGVADSEMAQNVPKPDRPRSDGAIPPLPPFNDNWPADVQVEWLTTYRQLIAR